MTVSIQFGQLAREHAFARRAENRDRVGERFDDAMARLIEDQRARFARRARCMRSRRAADFAGRKPSNTNRSLGRPATDSAAMAAHGPGTGDTSPPASRTARTSAISRIADQRRARIGRSARHRCRRASARRCAPPARARCARAARSCARCCRRARAAARCGACPRPRRARPRAAPRPRAARDRRGCRSASR